MTENLIRQRPPYRGDRSAAAPLGNTGWKPCASRMCGCIASSLVSARFRVELRERALMMQPHHSLDWSAALVDRVAHQVQQSVLPRRVTPNMMNASAAPLPPLFVH